MHGIAPAISGMVSTMNIKQNRLILIFAIAIAVLSCGSAGANPDENETIKQVAKLFAGWNGKVDRGVFKEAAGLIDYAEMSQIALGAHWEKLKQQEQADFVQKFQGLVEERYYKRWHKIFAKGNLSFLADEHNGDHQVKTILSVGKKHEMLIWTLSNKSGRNKVISLCADEKDLLKRLSSRVQNRLQKDGFNKLIAWMKDEAEEEED